MLIKELVDVVLAQQPSSSSTPVYYSGMDGLNVDGESTCTYVGVITAAESDAVLLEAPSGLKVEAPLGVPVTFYRAEGAFDFVGFRVFTPLMFE